MAETSDRQPPESTAPTVGDRQGFRSIVEIGVVTALGSLPISMAPRWILSLGGLPMDVVERGPSYLIMALFGFCFTLSKHPRLPTRIRHAVLSAVGFTVAVSIGLVAAAALLQWDAVRAAHQFVAWSIRNGLPFLATILAMVAAHRLSPATTSAGPCALNDRSDSKSAPGAG